MGQRRKPACGDLYCHFKGNLYEVVTLAIHSETKEEMVVYRQKYGAFQTYVRPLSMFLSEVDHEKYPGVKQKYRFELVAAGQGQAVEGLAQKERALEKQSFAASAAKKEPDNPNALLYAFLDAPTLKEKLKILEYRKETPTDLMITNMAISVDVVIRDGAPEDRLDELMDCLRTMARFECTRLR